MIKSCNQTDHSIASGVSTPFFFTPTRMRGASCGRMVDLSAIEPVSSRQRNSLYHVSFIANWRSEERRVGKESRSRWSIDCEKKKTKERHHDLMIRETNKHCIMQVAPRLHT